MNKIFKKFIERELKDIKWGEIQINLKNKYKNKFEGKEKGLSSNIDIHDYSFFKDVVLNGDLGFAESYIKKKWETSNLNHLLKIFLKNEQIKNKQRKPNFFINIFEKINFFLKKNSITQSKNNIAYHYDLGNDFYKIWLDETMTYSSAFFRNKDITLKDAQIQKYDSIIGNLNIKSEDHLLEVGSGWGGFINQTKNSIEGITISTKQYDYIKNNIIPIRENAKINYLDYRNIQGKFDKIVSIEMFEAVGKNYWKTFFNKMNSILNKNGSACFQIITINEKSFVDYIKNVDFIQKYIFPGGVLPTKKIIHQLAKDSGFKIYETISFGYDYAKTLSLWKNNFNKNLKSITSLNFKDGIII
jgi:cyclopropane-fatty-acyl-phospholipid synthase